MYDESGDTFMQDEEEGGGWEGFDDDNAGNDDDDDTSWKVRRASVKVIEAIINSRPDMLRLVYEKFATLLVGRFKERDDNVKCNILETYRIFLRCAVMHELSQGVDLDLISQPSLVRARSSVEELAKLVPDMVNELVK